MSITNIPMRNADIVTGVSLMLLFVFVGNLFGLKESLGFFTVLAAHITFNLPYVILSVMPRLRATDISLNEAALDLGCTPTKAFFKVILPSISTSIFTGAIMAFTLSLDDFVITQYLKEPSFETISTYIQKIVAKHPIPAEVRALSTILFVVVLAILIVVNIISARKEKEDAKRASAFSGK